MKRLWIVACVFCLVAIITTPGNAADTAPPVTAVLGAFDIEIELLKTEMTAAHDTTFMGVSFTRGILEGRDVVLAEVGIGKTNAAMTTTLLIDHFNPGEVLFTGIAGGLSPALLPGDIVIGAMTAHHDATYMTTDSLVTMASWNPISGERNPVLIPADERLLDLANRAGAQAELEKIAVSDGERTVQIIEGVIATGDSFIASESKKEDLRRRLHADAVEMEGAAVAQVCHQMSTPCIVIRSISDMADSRSAEDMERFSRIAANNSASIVRAMVALLARDTVRVNER